jgi:actin related protein 2/3 complex subunit 2
MILLEPGNRILAETVAAQINFPVDGSRTPLDVRLCDLDDVSYHVVVEKKDMTQMMVSMYLPCYDDIKDKGGEKSLNDTYGALVSADVQPNNSITLLIKFADLPADQKDKDALIKKISEIKPIVMGGLFRHYFDALKANTVPDVFKFQLRGDTTAYIVPGKDRVIVIYSMEFNAQVDKVLAKIAMNEFVDVRKKSGFQFAPPVTFTTNPPEELVSKFGMSADASGGLGFISFAILPNHITPTKVEKVVNVLGSYRNYIQYHLKCSKSYFASRMRLRTREMLKVLNRARVTQEEGGKKKVYKTATGKTFTRKRD